MTIEDEIEQTKQEIILESVHLIANNICKEKGYSTTIKIDDVKIILEALKKLSKDSEKIIKIFNKKYRSKLETE